MSKITIQDVAQRAGVSVATIDRVLNRRPGVRSQTVEKVETAIRELNYQPDRIAARLARGREYRLWFVLPTTAGEFFQRINDEVEDSARRMAAERVAIDQLGPVDRALLGSARDGERAVLSRRAGRRVTTADAYLQPHRRPTNIEVVGLPPASPSSGGGSEISSRMAQCPKCGEAALIRIEGCDQCTSCGYSKCG